MIIYYIVITNWDERISLKDISCRGVSSKYQNILKIVKYLATSNIRLLFIAGLYMETEATNEYSI